MTRPTLSWWLWRLKLALNAWYFITALLSLPQRPNSPNSGGILYVVPLGNLEYRWCHAYSRVRARPCTALQGGWALPHVKTLAKWKIYLILLFTLLSGVLRQEASATSHRLKIQYVLVRLGTEMKEVEIKNAGGLRLKTLCLLVCLVERGGRFHGKMRDNRCWKAAICASSARRLLTTAASSYETRCAAHCYSTLSSHWGVH